LKPESARIAVGLDTVTITPTSKNGYTAIVVIVNHFTHLTYLHPVKDHTAEAVCEVLMRYVGNFSLFDELRTDPGSELTSKALEQFTAWLGVRQKFSVTDIHTSCGVENTNRRIIQHLQTLVNDYRLVEDWDENFFISMVQYYLNSEYSGEAGVSPFHATFGSADETYYKLPQGLPQKELTTEYIRLLDVNLEKIREASRKYQQDLVSKRSDREPRTQFQVTDLVLKNVRSNTKHWKPEKLGPEYLGPYEVTAVNENSNVYTVKHVTQGFYDQFDVTQIKPYFGTKAMAKRAALLDFNQYVVKVIHHYTGDYKNRQTMEFYVEYADGDIRWQVWSQDLFTCQAYVDFCKSRPELWSMIMTVNQATKARNRVNKEPILDVTPGDIYYVDLRVFGGHWYNGNEDLEANSCIPTLPEIDYSIYVVPFSVIDWGNVKHTTLKLYSEVLDWELKWNHDLYLCWGQYRKLSGKHKLVDEEFVKKFPQVKTSLHAPIPTRPRRNAPRAPNAGRGGKR